MCLFLSHASNIACQINRLTKTPDQEPAAWCPLEVHLWFICTKSPNLFLLPFCSLSSYKLGFLPLCHLKVSFVLLALHEMAQCSICYFELCHPGRLSAVPPNEMKWLSCSLFKTNWHVFCYSFDSHTPFLIFWHNFVSSVLFIVFERSTVTC